ncbi:MAG: hypothetical protein DMG79_00445 [Acidobacteria bacterium]|nr:MAG: hypothetical protein DMG79_00445 [Acidobacteriota bacterium]
MHRPRLSVLFCLLLVGSALGQFRAGTLRVRVTFSDGRPCNQQVRVQLMNSASRSPVSEAFTNDSGMTEFNNVELGNYHLIVSGEGIEEADSGIFEIDNRRGSQFIYVPVKQTKDANRQANALHGSRTVAAADLNIPARAAKEFDKATKLLERQQWKKAMIQLHRALAVYPRYAAAYNNLGVVYAKLGDRASERTALQKAVELNDHFAPAFVNLARMSIVDRDFPAAETLLDKANSIDPSDFQALLLLANVELLDHHYEQAIANSRKVHALAQDSHASDSHALVHYIAARAFEHESRLPDAAAEFQIFLAEESEGARAEAVRKELASLKTHAR